MPLDPCLARLVRRDWLIDGPLGGYLTSYIESLKTRRYAQGTMGAYLRCLAHFSFWMTAEGLTIANIDLPLIERFIRHHLPACTCPAPCRSDINEVRAALHHLQTLLPAVNDENITPLALELEQFNGYLRDICGLAPLTCSYRIQHVKAFLVGRFGNDAPEVGLLVSDDIDAFLNELASTWSPASRKLICTSLRSYLRFHAMLGEDTRILSAALPTIANWRRRHPPEVLSEVQLEQFLRAFDQTHPVELRDYVIARFLLDLGLRADEVAHLTLDCVDWRNGIVTLYHTKSQRVQQFPLPTQTGEALERYLRLGRPHTTNRALFPRHRAPFGVALSVDAIRNTMNRAFVRSGLADRFCNTHVLRRSMATRLQKSGVSIKEIADMLRHRDLNTARAYARVDLEHLRAVAIPWPGSKS